MKKNARIFAAIALLSALIGVYFGVQYRQPTALESQAVNALFSQSLPDTYGKLQPLAQWKNRKLVVNFWATWCAPCVQEMPELSALQHEIANRNIQVIGVGIDSASNIAEFALKHKIDFPLYIAGMNGIELSRQFGNQAGGLPFTALIDSNGSVKKTYLGRLKFDELRKDLAAF
jgi:thiol-disulfide isomerase/thioredoxin